MGHFGNTTQLFAADVSKYYYRDFTNLQEIGKGGEATAYKGYNHSMGEVCLKVFQFHQNNRVGPSYDEVRLLLKHSHHPNVVVLYGLIEQENSTYQQLTGYVMEYCAGGSLHSVIHGNMQYNERHVCNWVLQAARGLAHLHEREIIHRDVKPSNMLLSQDYNTLKLADFGIAQRVATSNCSSGGTCRYMAPELHTNQQIGTPVDVYALGISFWEMLYRKRPFSKYRETRKIIDKVTWENKRPPIDETFSSTLTDLVKSCWKNHPTDRIRIMELIICLTNYKDQNEPRNPTIAPAEGGRMMENSSAHNSRAHAHYQSLPNNPNIPRNQGANDEFDLVDHIRELSMGSQNSGTLSERKERKHRKKNRKEKRVTESDEEEEAVFFPSSSASQPNSVPTSSASAAVNVAPETLLSTIYSHLLRLEPDVFQLTVANFEKFMITCQQDLANFSNGQANLSAKCVRVYGLGPEGYIPNPEEILEQHIKTQILQKQVVKLEPCLFMCTFTFGPNNYADINILNQAFCAFQASCSIYDADCRRIPRFIIDNQFNIFIVGTSPSMSAGLLYKSLKRMVQNGLPDPEELYNLKINLFEISTHHKLADAARSINTNITKLGAVHQVIYLVDVNNWHGTGTFGPEWKTLASEEHALFYVGCTGEDQHLRNTIRIAQQFTFTNSIIDNVLPFFDETSFARLWADRQRVYKAFHLIHRRAIMNLVNKVPPLSCYS